MKNKPIKVCMLTTSFPRWEGDYAASFIYDLCVKLVEKGVRVTVVAPHDGLAPKYEKFDGTEIYRFRYMWPKYLQKLAYGGGIPHNLRSSFFAKCQLPFFFWLFFKSGIYTAKKCDVIHAHWILSGLVGIPIKKLSDKPLIITVHGSDVNYLPRSGLMHFLAVKTFESSEIIITVSNALKQKLIEYGIDRNKIKVIPNGVDTVYFSPKNVGRSENNILWVGRMTEEKGLSYLIEAMAKVVDERPDATLTLVGDGKLRKNLEKQASKLGIRDNIYFEGIKPHNAIPTYLRQAKLLILPSLSEGLPLTLLEAMACEIPVVATKIGGIPDVVKDGENGILVPPKDPKALSMAILKFMENETTSDEFGKNARELILKKYSLNMIVDETIGAYSKLIKQPPSSLKSADINTNL